MLIPRCLTLLCMFIVKAYMMISIQGNLFLRLDLNETASILPISVTIRRKISFQNYDLASNNIYCNEMIFSHLKLILVFII